MKDHKFHLMTDSTSDISQAEAKKLGITVLPLGINFGTESYIDGVTLTTKEFFKKLRKCTELPKTSLISDETIREGVLKNINKTEVVFITISSGMSGTYGNAMRVKKELPEAQGKKFHIVDSEVTTISLGALVLEAIKMRDNGATAMEVVKEMEILRHKVEVLAVIDTLKYLKMGGRIKPTKFIIGNLLNIKPICSLQDKVVVNVGKAMGYAKARHEVLRMIGEYEIDTNRVFLAGHTDNIENANILAKMAKEKFGIKEVQIRDIGATVGTHIGPDASGLVFFKK
ncbi:MAG: DegV family protein [Firmicutes bacterium]|nr:DegV family protein [Bacillota bacterium]MCL2771608.1 DegV family protein [Bacillota bacterium]